ncbi:MAG: hypothetical protein FJ207_08790 [Gemmatimonadetes bacterium]|nr:hypothetical protein [Gemmatimonadota bacterium]
MEAHRPVQSRGIAGTRAFPIDVGRGLILLAAGLSFLLSVYLFFSGNPEQGIFVGIWVPSILSAGTLLIGGPRG